MVGLAHVPHRRYSPGIKITTVGEHSQGAGQPLGGQTVGERAAFRQAVAGAGGWATGEVCMLDGTVGTQEALMQRHRCPSCPVRCPPPTRPRPTPPPAGNKASLELRGPMETTPLKPRDVPMAVAAGLASGLRGAVSAATGAAEALRSQGSQQLRAAAKAAEADEFRPREIVSQVSLRESESEAQQAPPPQEQRQRQRGSPAVQPPGQQPHRDSPFAAPAEAVQPPTALRPGAPGVPAGAGTGSSPHLGRSPSGSAHGTPAQGTPGALTPTAAAAFAAKPKHLRRASMQDNSFVETVATEPGTMLVRVTSGIAATPTARALHRL